ncbi:MAG: substrate-binding domain-containing protein, partial [Cetobacterium sp.]
IVLLDRKFSSENIYSVLINNTNGILKILNHIDDLSFKKVYIIEGKDSYDNKERKNAIEYHKRNFNIEKIEYFQGDFTEESGYKIAEKYFSKEAIPDAIISFNDEMAIGIINYLKKIDINIPEDVSIFGFDDIEIGRYITPKLSTVSYSKRKIGYIAAETVIKTINKTQTFQSLSLMETELILRESSK